MEDLAIFYPEGHEKHFEPGHPERPERVEEIRKLWTDEGIWEKATLVPPSHVPPEILHNVHDPGYLKLLQDSSERGQRLDMDTYITPASWQLALKSAGGGISVAEKVWEREAKRGFALCRPPGHHATTNQAMGFCLMNNISIAAEYVLQVKGAEKIAIIDIDLHHGNGTQDIFWSRGDVFFFSIHQFPLYPYSGRLDDTGSNAGEKTTANIPFGPQAGDKAREAALNDIILPLLDKFEPNMLLISAGFDAHWRDPLGHQLVSTDGYGSFFSQLASWADNHCDGRMAVILEGGYDLEAGATSALAITQAMLGLQWEDPIGKSPIPEDSRWETILKEVKEIWDL